MAARDDVAYSVSWPGWPKVSMHYRVVDPAAVTLKFYQTATAKPHEWLVSRDVLKEGLIYTNGLGDFQCGPEDSENVFIELYPGRTDATKVLLSRRYVAWFLHQSALLVPYETENYDMQLDTFITNCLEGAM